MTEQSTAVAELAGMASAVGYAQVRSLIGSLLGGPPRDPEELVTLAIRKVELADRIDALSTDALTAALIEVIRAETIGSIVQRTRAGDQMPSLYKTARFALAFGRPEWFEAVVDAGARAVLLSHEEDRIVFASSVRLLDYARGRRETARRRHADTEPIVRVDSQREPLGGDRGK